MTAMSIKRDIGIVLGLMGTLFLLLHLALMIFTDLARRYHNSEGWVVIGILMAVAGLLILSLDRKNGDGV
jgi:multisubunit Na+/H+ antiporter MnhG subunit